MLFQNIVFDRDTGILYFAGENEIFYMDGTKGVNPEVEEARNHHSKVAPPHKAAKVEPEPAPAEDDEFWKKTCHTCSGTGFTKHGHECGRCAGTGLGSTMCECCQGLGETFGGDFCRECAGMGRVPYGTKH